MSDQAQRRQFERKPVSLGAKCRTTTGLRDQAQISDLSTHGRCLSTHGLYYRTGMKVFVTPAGFEGLAGVVRWVEGYRCGIEFDRPLYAPVVEHLSSIEDCEVRLH